ncbi:MAG: hypothetical protein ABW318_14310 [Vicinamibacterales bacterium]
MHRHLPPRSRDLYRIFLTAQRDGLDFNLAYIPTDFNASRKEEFDREYMQALFERGYRMAAGVTPGRRRHHERSVVEHPRSVASFLKDPTQSKGQP